MIYTLNFLQFTIHLYPFWTIVKSPHYKRKSNPRIYRFYNSFRPILRHAHAHLFKLINNINVFVTACNARRQAIKRITTTEFIHKHKYYLIKYKKKNTIHAVFDKINSTIPHFTIIEKLNRYARNPHIPYTIYRFCWPLPSCALHL